MNQNVIDIIFPTEVILKEGGGSSGRGGGGGEDGRGGRENSDE
jgi:hypothetical protein